MYACFQEQGLAFVIVMKMARLPVAALPESRLKKPDQIEECRSKKKEEVQGGETSPFIFETVARGSIHQ
ncbi:MAG: hypothetical protein JNM22_08070 [Saprospiraceae bacterium]|nr:hypothetical protein [Saprospiraceae bacterium]